MKELYFYRFVMICLVLGATFLAGHHYGEPVVEQLNDQFSFARSSPQASQVRVKTPVRSFDTAVRVPPNQDYSQPLITYPTSLPPTQRQTAVTPPTVSQPQSNFYPSGIQAGPPRVSLHWQPATPVQSPQQYQPVGTLTPFVSTNNVVPPTVYPPGVPSQLLPAMAAQPQPNGRLPKATLERPQKLGANSNPMPLPYKRAQPVLSLPPDSKQPSSCPCASDCPNCPKTKPTAEATNDQSAATKTKTPLVDEIMEIRHQLGSGLRLKLVLPGENPSASDVAIFEETIKQLAKQKLKAAKQAEPPQVAETLPEFGAKKPQKPRSPSKR